MLNLNRGKKLAQPQEQEILAADTYIHCMVKSIQPPKLCGSGKADVQNFKFCNKNLYLLRSEIQHIVVSNNLFKNATYCSLINYVLNLCKHIMSLGT